MAPQRDKSVRLPALVSLGGLVFVAWAPAIAGLAVAILTASFWCAWLEG
jgi:hypothetical protein